MRNRNLQYVTNNTYAPYVSTKSNLIEVYDFRSNKLRCTEQHLQFLIRIVFSRQTKIDDFDSITFFRQAQDILRLHNRYIYNYINNQIKKRKRDYVDNYIFA